MQADAGQPNPVAERYRQWARETPLVTRSLMQVLVVFYVASFFLNTYALVNVPYFTIMSVELYRLLLAPFFTTSFFNLVFALMTLFRMGTTLEASLGSSALLVMLLTLALVTQVLFTAFALTVAILGYAEAMLWSAGGAWLLVIALLAIECLEDPRPTRRLFFLPIEVPTRYFPLALYALYSLFLGLRIDMLCALAVGYAYAQGRLDRLKPSSSLLRSWEDAGPLAALAEQPGFVRLAAAAGAGAWQVNDPTSGGYSGWGAQGAPPRDAEAAWSSASAPPAGADLERFSGAGSGRALGGSAAGGGAADAAAAKVPSREELLARRAAAYGEDARTPQDRGRRPEESPISGPFDANLMQLTAMGFARADAVAALKSAGGDLSVAIGKLSGDV